MSDNTFRYIKLDYQSHKEALLSRIRSRWSGQWNDFSVSGFGMIFVDIMSWSLSTLAFVVHKAVSESFTTSMKQRESAIRIGSLVGYRLKNPQPALVYCEASIPSSQASIITIPEGTIVRTSNSQSIPFEITRNYFIEPGKLTPSTTLYVINPSTTGENTISSYITVTKESKNIDLNDTSIDLFDLISEGQTIKIGSDSISYTINSVEFAPNAISRNRIVINENYRGETKSNQTGEIIETRIQLSQGQTTTENYRSPSITDRYAIILQESSVIAGSIKVKVNSTTFTEVDNAQHYSGSDNIFISREFSTGKTYLQFGDGVFGSKIQPESEIEVIYKFGGGEIGNIEKNSFATSITGIINSTDSPITISLSNRSSTGTGGSGEETVEEARYKIPEYIKANDRAVTAGDYSILASSYGPVSHAIASPRRVNSLHEGNIIDVYAWTRGPRGSLLNLDPQLKQDLKNYLQSKSITTDFVVIKNGLSRPVPMSIRFKSLPGFDVDTTKELVLKTIESFINNYVPGSTLVYSDMVSLIDSTPGIDKIDIASPSGDILPYNSTELFTIPDDSFSYPISKYGVGNSIETLDEGNIELYIGQIPLFPLQPWSLSLFLDDEELTILPGLLPGTADIYGESLTTTSHLYDSSVSVFDTDPKHKFRSTINLLTGSLRLWVKGVAGDLSMKLKTVHGYSRTQGIDVFIGYSGDNSIEKRREIRIALKEYSKGLGVGNPIYGKEVNGITASKSNISSIISEISGVANVNRVALSTPNSVDPRILTTPLTLLYIKNIVINNEID